MSNRTNGSLIGAASIVLCVVLFVGGKAIKLSREAREAETHAKLEADRIRQETEDAARRAEAADVFTNPQPPTPEDTERLLPFFDSLGEALTKEDALEFTNRMDVSRLFDELVKTGAFQFFGKLKPSEAERAGFVRGFTKGAAQAVRSNPLFRWQQTTIHRVRWSPDRTEVIVIASHIHESELFGRDNIKLRWWLKKRGNEWCFYDYEDLETNLRISTLLTTILAEPQFAKQLTEVINNLRTAVLAITQQKLEVAEESLQKCRAVRLPQSLDAVVTLGEARLCLEKQETNLAMEKIERVEFLRRDMPVTHGVRALCYLQQGEFAKAHASLDKYVAHLGNDNNVFSIRGTIFESENKIAEAKQTYREALDDDADAVDLLVALANLTDKDELKELGERLANTKDPRKTYDTMLQRLGFNGTEDIRSALLDGLRKSRPEDSRGLSDDIRRLVPANQLDEAKKLLALGLKAKKREDSREVLNAFVFAMITAKKELEAYHAVPDAFAAEAFRTIAEDLEEVYDEVSVDAEAIAKLKELLAAHRKRVPTDPWCWFYEGAILQYAKDYEKAATAFGTGRAMLPPVVDDDSDEPKDWQRSQFRWRQAMCLYRAKMGLQAYETVAPASETFQQLAGLYERANEFDDLAALIAAHRKQFPKDIQLTYWQGQLLFRKMEYERATVLLKKFLKETEDKTANHWTARDSYLRGTLRSDPAAAVKALEEFPTERISLGLRAAIAAASGDRTELERLLAEVTKNGGQVWFYHDEDFRRFILAEQYRDLRKKYPDPNPPPKMEG